MSDDVQMSRAAFEQLEAEIEKLETVDRPAIAEKISVAREDGDLKENAEYHAAKNDQSFLETRILQLRQEARRRRRGASAQWQAAQVQRRQPRLKLSPPFVQWPNRLSRWQDVSWTNR